MSYRNRYPIGQQDFKVLREGDALYVDKTEFISKIVKSESRYYFLARPRRFGKSLFLSTLRYFFEGKRELFRGLYIDSTDWDWESYPVFRLDLNVDRYAEPGVLDRVLDNLFRKWEREYGVVDVAEDLSIRFMNIIKAAHEKTGRQVVILVDEYDKPLVGNLNNDDNFGHYRLKLAGVYSSFKSSAEHIRLVFLTGVSRFSKLSVFSDLNNISDITFDSEFSDVCGITEKELLENFHEGINSIAEEYETDFGGACALLKKNYDGYRFGKRGSDIYNPWSVLKAMSERRIGGYWNATGAASIIAETLHKLDVDLESTLNSRWALDQLAGLDLRNANPTALLYQTGYLTIAEYDRDSDTVLLKIPNEEVKKGLFNDMLPFYTTGRCGKTERTVFALIDHIRRGSPDQFMKNLTSYFALIPYDLKMENENNFQNALYILLTLIGVNTKAEVHTSDGRIDLVIETPKYIYIIELKYDSTAEEALRQIDEKQYAAKFIGDPRKLFRIGVSFSSKTRRIEGWKVVAEG